MKLLYTLAVFAALTACGGRSHTSLPQIPGPVDYFGALANATFTIKIPGPSTVAKVRHPAYVSSATKSLKITLNSASALTGAQVAAYNGRPWGTINTGTLPNATCPASGADFACTVTIQMPPGADNLTFSAYDNTNGSGNILSAQIQSFTFVAAVANNFSIILDANITGASGAMLISGSGSCQAGPIGSVFGSVGTTPITFTAAYTDAQGKGIVGPGLPKLQIQDNGSTYQASSGTINGTGGTVSFTINQAAQSFTLTPSNSSTTNAAVNIKAVQADSNGSSDGLSFAKTQSFTFSTGAAPPSHNFLAAVEQTGTNSGQVDLFNMTLGGSGGTDTFSAFSPATLAVTNSTNENKQDVDNPLQLAWDSTGDLLIANGGTTVGGDYGNLACVPVGAIATGANTATTVSSDVNDPVSMSYNTTDGSVGLSNNGSSATVKFSEYVLNGNYGEAPVARTITNALSSNANVALPTLTAGTYALDLTNGTETDPAHGAGTALVRLLSPSGVATDITDDTAATGYAVDVPQALAWDSLNSQLIIANHSTWHKTVSFYTVSPVARQKVINTSQRNYMLATTADGHVAVAGLSASGSGQSKVLIYANASGTTIPTLVGAIPFNLTTTQCGATYVYGTAAVRSMTWLSNTKLLIALQSGAAGKNGLYVFDISSSATPAGFGDESGCPAATAGPKQTGFQAITNFPLGTAFKP